MSPEEDRTRDAMDSKPKHYQLSYSGPNFFISKSVDGRMCVIVIKMSQVDLGIQTEVVGSSAWHDIHRLLVFLKWKEPRLFGKTTFQSESMHIGVIAC